MFVSRQKSTNINYYCCLIGLVFLVLLQAVLSHWLRIIGTVFIAVGTFFVITRFMSEHRQLVNAATRDELTGLDNFRAYKERIHLETERAVRQCSSLTLILIDLDKFKNYNDTFGHRQGNELLRLCGRVMREGVRSTDGIYRFGGDEFAIILPDTEVRDAQMIAERISQAFDRLNIQGQVTLSIGLAEFYAGEETPEEFFDRVDNLLYNVKTHGGNGCLTAGLTLPESRNKKKDPLDYTA